MIALFDNNWFIARVLSRLGKEQKRARKFILQLLLILLASLYLTGCGAEVLYSNLSEADANTMMGLLLARNIQAVKTAQKENLFSVSVPRSEFSAATDLLRWYGIPGEKFSGIGEVFQKTGIVSSPSEEKIRFMYALSQQISETLSHIDGVLVARVSLVLPKNDPYTETLTPSSASVFLKFRPGRVPPTLIPQIKTLVMKSVEGLNYDNVSVVIVQSENIDYYYPISPSVEKKFLGIKIEGQGATKILFLLVLVALVSASFVLLIFLGKGVILDFLKKRKENSKSELPSSEVPVIPVEAPQDTPSTPPPSSSQEG